MAAIVTEQGLRMNGGDGETSYANNSSVQKMVMLRAKAVIKESLTKMYCTSDEPIRCLKVADLGCSSGPNALLLVSNIIQFVDEITRSLKNNVETPIFQFFLNDLFGNDFNTIFKSLPQFYETLKVKCFINAMPGSFYGRLFPSNSIHFFHSSSSIHWLSQVPKLNGKGRKRVKKEQFKEDFKVFLTSRSEELVKRGTMVLTLIGRYDSPHLITHEDLIFTLLNDMASENLIEEAKLESFSIPIHHPTAEEVREIIKEEGSFSVERVESIKTSWDGSSSLSDDEEDGKCFVDNERGKFIAKGTGAVLEPLLKAHFGEGINMDQVFLRFHNKLVQLKMAKLVHPTLVISLIKNA